MGRKSTFDQTTANEICERLAEGETLISICDLPEFPSLGTVLGWASDNSSFGEAYARARDVGWRILAERLLTVTDDTSIEPNSRRIMVDTRKWMLSKMLPKIYGDRLNLEHSGKVQTEQALTDAELAAIAAKGK